VDKFGHYAQSLCKGGAIMPAKFDGGILTLPVVINRSRNMPITGLRAAAFASCAALVFFLSSVGAPGQSGDQAADPSKSAPSQADAARQEKKARADRATEAGQALKGPAANPECVWLGERVVGLLWRDDLDTAFRHLELYDRFGCPGGHVQTTFRCVVRQGNIDPKATETLNSRVHSCWLDPELAAAAAPPPAPAPTVQTAPGTNSR
jgi:hypothetical protein